MYAYKIEKLKELENLSMQGLIDLYYGDESHLSSEGYVPYGWQFPDENVAIYVEKGHKINIFGLINRQNHCHWATTQQSINSQFVIAQLEELSFKIKKETFVVLDNASVHHSKIFQQQVIIWQQRGLFLFFLPTYSPHLNIAETMWRKLKTEWIIPEDYLEKDSLFYAVNRCMANIGTNLKIYFSPFNTN